jgi:hypothetical protein
MWIAFYYCAELGPTTALAKHCKYSLEEVMQIVSSPNLLSYYNYATSGSPTAGSSGASSSNSADIAPSASKATTQAANSAGSASSVQLDTQTLVALLNAQEGRYGATQAPFSPSSPTQTPPPQFINPSTTGGFEIASSDGALTSSELQGQSAAGLASDMIGTFGSNGTLSLNDVDGALGLNDSTDPPQLIQQMKSEIATAWNSLSGGSSVLSSDQLASAIGSRLSVTS